VAWWRRANDRAGSNGLTNSEAGGPRLGDSVRTNAGDALITDGPRSGTLLGDYANWRSYYPLSGQQIALPMAREDWRSPEPL
jgi:hypothetical protein